MAFKPIDRRTVLRGLGGMTLALPWLEAMSGCSSPSNTASPRGSLGRRSQALGTPGLTKDGMPRRIIVLASPNGTLPEAWFPSTPGKSFSLGPIHAPLAPYQDRMVLFRGIHNEVAKKPLEGPIPTGHNSGQTSLLTGTRPQGPAEEKLIGSGISFDQVIAKAIDQTPTRTPFASLALGTRIYYDPFGSLSYAGPGSPTPQFIKARALFDAIFPNPVPPDQEAKLRARRKSVLDGVLDDGKTLRARLGSNDQKRLDEHLDTVHSLEKKLGQVIQCDPSGLNAGQSEYDFHDGIKDMIPQMYDVLTLALSCDVSRVVTYMFRKEGAFGAHTFPFLGVGKAGEDDPFSGAANGTSHHSISHWDHDADNDNFNRLLKINTWYMSQIADLIERLKKIPEGNGSVFDNTIILYGSGIAEGGHTLDHIPFMLLGNGGGAIQTGQYLDVGSRPHNDLLLTLMRAMDLGDTTFGDPEYSKPDSVIPGVLAT